MTEERDELYNLLPALYRQRDEDRGAPLKHLLAVLADELAVIRDGVDQLYDDLFVETASPWALPYLAELIGLHGLPSGSGSGVTPRAEVANTLGYRRRKGTAAVLEQMVRDITGWPTRAVEYFELLAATQNVHHVRPANLAFAPVRDAHRLEYVNSPFERLADQPDLTHTVDVRRIGSRRGRYNIGNIGLFSWRIRAYRLRATPAVPADPADATRFHVHPLGVRSPLFTSPVTEDEITHLAEPLNVSHPLGRREFAASVGSFYGSGLSVHLPGVPADTVDVCDLSDVLDAAGNVTSWAHTPRAAGRVAIDPVLGRVAFGDDQPDPPTVSHHYGFSADVGSGEYNRAHTFAGIEGSLVRVSRQDPTAAPTIDAGLAALAGSGTVEIRDGLRYGPVPDLTVAGRSVEIRATDHRRPLVALGGELTIDGDGEGELTLNGLLITGGTLRVRNLRALRLVHCTLVPGVTLNPDGSTAAPRAPSVVAESPATAVTIERCITGPLWTHVDADATLTDSICDAGQSGVAYAGLAGDDAGGRLTLEACTVLGKIHTCSVDVVSNSILLAAVQPSDDQIAWPGPVLVDRRQEGCFRFSFVPPGSRTPRRHHCQPVAESSAAQVRPVLASDRYPDPTYCQLDQRTVDEIWRGADDESEMGVFHHLFTPRRLAYLQARLDDYLRLGLEAGFFFAS